MDLHIWKVKPEYMMGEPDLHIPAGEFHDRGHPVMSIIVTILVFEILTGKTLVQHSEILKRRDRKTIVITLLVILLSYLITNGNGFDPVLAIMSIAGSLPIIAVLYRLSKGTDIAQLVPEKRGFRVLCLYLLALYINIHFSAS